MPLFRILAKGFSLAIRAKKRSGAFVILFIVITGWLILQLAILDAYDTDRILDARGVILEPSHELNAASAYESINEIYDAVKNEISGLYIVYYVEVYPGQLGLITVKSRGKGKPEHIPWVLDLVKPTRIVNGRAINGRGEGLINVNALINYSIPGGIQIIQSAKLGDYITLQQGNKKVDIRIVGMYNASIVSYSKIAKGTENLLYVSWEDFEYFVEDIWPSPADNAEKADYVFVRRIILIAGGDYFSGKALTNVESIRISLTQNPIAPFSVTLWGGVDQSIYVSDWFRTVVLLLGAIILGGIYSFLLIRYKKKEIATLRAIGWRGKDVLIFLLGELIFVTIVGFIVGLLGVSAFSTISNLPPISFNTIGITFIVILAAILFGYYYIWRGILRISPMEAFRRE
ncbi:MAG: ABC transporter permease [Candidatus Njordarchaeia archaeon]